MKIKDSVRFDGSVSQFFVPASIECPFNDRNRL